ncbi:unnamed protein product [Ixodes pacificus]
MLQSSVCYNQICCNKVRNVNIPLKHCTFFKWLVNKLGAFIHTYYTDKTPSTSSVIRYVVWNNSLCVQMLCSTLNVTKR